MNNYPFSLVRNDGRMFPELRKGDVVVFGNHRRSFAQCDYEGNMNRTYPGNKPTTERWLPLGKDQDSIMAWHGDRKKDGHVEMVRVDWSKALKNREKREKRDKKRNSN
jgi:hypothetical protein